MFLSPSPSRPSIVIQPNNRTGQKHIVHVQPIGRVQCTVLLVRIKNVFEKKLSLKTIYFVSNRFDKRLISHVNYKRAIGQIIFFFGNQQRCLSVHRSAHHPSICELVYRSNSRSPESSETSIKQHLPATCLCEYDLEQCRTYWRQQNNHPVHASGLHAYLAQRSSPVTQRPLKRFRAIEPHTQHTRETVGAKVFCREPSIPYGRSIPTPPFARPF